MKHRVGSIAKVWIPDKKKLKNSLYFVLPIIVCKVNIYFINNLIHYYLYPLTFEPASD